MSPRFSVMTEIMFVLLLGALFAPQTVTAKGPVKFEPIRESLVAGRWDDVLKKVDREQSNGTIEDQQFLNFTQMIAFIEKRDWNQAIKSAANLKSKGPLWDDYADYLTAEARFGLGQLKQSRQAIDRIVREKSNYKVASDAQLLLGKVALAEGRFEEAKRVLTKIEKSVRATPVQPHVIWQIARAEKGLKNHSSFCGRLLRLYRDFPDFEMTASWGPFLDENKFEGEQSLCSFGWVDALVRTKNLLMNGQVDRTRKEIQLISDRSQGQKTFEIDRLMAQYLIHEGEVTHALQLLSPYFQQKKNDVSYLSLMASAANRAGDSSTAIGTYLIMAKLAPRSSSGRNALFQAAFLSYQFQDYDGAIRRFKEFLQAHPGSSLALDAEWNISWISYLKGQFDVAYEGLAKLRTKINNRKARNRSQQSIDRIEYWMAMSQFRLKDYAQAKSLFGELYHRGNEGSYYTIASAQRLKQLEQLAPSKELQIVKSIGRWVASTGARMPARFLIHPVLAPPDDTRQWAHSVPASDEGADSKAVVRDDIESAVEAVTEETDQALMESAPLSTEDDLTQNLSSSPNPLIVQKFERARRLISVGLFEWAKWELYEIERKTANKDYLRGLMAEYEKIGNFHRSSQIAANNFAKARLDGGIDNQKSLWEKAYPKAYGELVTEFSRKFDIPQELVWSIMRAESSYRKEATSPVGALGLMQVMPKTGQKIAEGMGEKSFEPRKLLEPNTAIKVGAKYLSRLWRRMEGNRALVAGAYNAGPHRIFSWLTRFGTLELDEFIEHVPYLETRNYIKRVVSNYQVYARVYANQEDVFPELSQPIAVKVKDGNLTKETWEDI